MGILDRFKRKKEPTAIDYFKMGNKARDSRNLEGALEFYGKAIELDPKLVMAYYERANLYSKLGRKEEAVKDYIKFLEFDRRDSSGGGSALKAMQIGWQRGAAEGEIKRFGTNRVLDEIIANYDPNAAYVNERLYKLIHSDLKKIEKENPAEATYRVGVVHILKGEFDKAIKELGKAIELNPKNAWAYYFRGIACIKERGEVEKKRFVLGRSEKMVELKAMADRDFGQAMSLATDPSLIAQVKRQLGVPVPEEVTKVAPCFCPFCGNKLSEGAVFCSNCGKMVG